MSTPNRGLAVRPQDFWQPSGDWPTSRSAYDARTPVGTNGEYELQETRSGNGDAHAGENGTANGHVEPNAQPRNVGSEHFATPPSQGWELRSVTPGLENESVCADVWLDEA